MRRDSAKFKLLLIALIGVALALLVSSTAFGAIGSPIQIFADDSDSTTATPTPTPATESDDSPPTPMGTPASSSSGGRSTDDGSTYTPGSSSSVGEVSIAAGALVNATLVEAAVEQQITNYRLQNEIDESTLDELNTAGRTAERVDELADEHSQQLAANESVWGPHSYEEYNWESLYERHELTGYCQIGGTNEAGTDYTETYERGHLMAVTEVSATNGTELRNQTEIAEAAMDNWQNNSYSLGKIELNSADRLGVGVAPSNETDSVYITAAIC